MADLVDVLLTRAHAVTASALFLGFLVAQAPTITIDDVMTVHVHAAAQTWSVGVPSSAVSTHPSTSCSPAIRTTIDGTFKGWNGETVFKLSNGQVWQQSEYSHNHSRAYRPEVTIFQAAGGCKLKVQDADETILVKRIK